MCSWKRRYLVGVLLLLGLFFLTWLAWPDPRMAKAAELRQELFGPAAKKMSDQERRQRFAEYRELTRGLSPAQRRQLSAQGRREKQREIAGYFGLAPAEKTRYLDNLIRQQKSRPARPSGVGGGGQPKSGQAKGGGSTPQERDRRRQGFLDGSSPAERAMMARFSRELNSRRAQLGLQPRGGR